VTLPLILPGVMAGALLAFTLSFDDFVITFFVSGVGSSTLPLKIYSMIKFGVSPVINALSTVVIVVTMVLVLGGSSFLSRKESA
jgi:spermidine/putrescine transport system permease protein